MGALTRRFVAVSLTLGCAPELVDDSSQIRSLRVLAVRAEPAEPSPGETVRLRALVVAPDGTATEPSLRWSFCTARRALATRQAWAPAAAQEAHC